jgi:hypothetical protein
MKLLVYGTENFADYNTFMRAVIVAMDGKLTDNRLEIYSAGPFRINSYTAEFVNRSENFLKQKKVKSRFYKVLKRDVVENFDNYGFDSVVYLSTSGDKTHLFDTILKDAEDRNIDVSIYRS